VQTLNVISEDDYADFFVQTFGMFSKDPAIEKINGMEYTARIIKSLALFPHQSGTYTIDPMVLDVGINAPFPGIQGFFTMKRIQDVRIASAPLTLEVLPLPGDAPASFNGAVGQYAISTSGEQRQMTTDDALTFYLEIIGNGDSRRWDPPVAVADSVFDMYDPKIIDDQLAERAGQIEHRRRIEYQMLPQAAGIYAIAVPFTYFDPDQERYMTISSDTFSIQVAQGSSHLGRISGDETERPSDVLMPYGQPLLSDRFWRSWPHLLLFGLIVSGSCWTMIISYRRRRESSVPEWLRVRRDAVHHGLAQLDELQRTEPEMAGRIFYEKATEIFQRFLCERFAISPADLDETRLTGYLVKEKIPDDLAERIAVFFRQSLVVRYGGIPSGFSRPDMLATCRSILTDVREATGI
jgi:hypothetical protein